MGSFPVKALLEKFRDCALDSPAQERGRVPFRLLLPTLMLCRLLALDQVLGNAPALASKNTIELVLAPKKSATKLVDIQLHAVRYGVHARAI